MVDESIKLVCVLDESSKLVAIIAHRFDASNIVFFSHYMVVNKAGYRPITLLYKVTLSHPRYPFSKTDSSGLTKIRGGSRPVDACHAIGDVDGESYDLVGHLRPLLSACDVLGRGVGEHPADVAQRRPHGGATPVSVHEGDDDVLRAGAAASVSGG